MTDPAIAEALQEETAESKAFGRIARKFRFHCFGLLDASLVWAEFRNRANGSAIGRFLSNDDGGLFACSVFVFLVVATYFGW